MNKVIIALLIIVAIAGAVFFLNGRSDGSDSALENIRRATIDRGDLIVSVSATGSIVARKQVNLSFDLPGKVKTVKVEVGDFVSKGDDLARLDDANHAFQVRQAHAALDSAQAQLDQLLADARPQEVAAAQANLEAAQAAVWSAVAQRDQVKRGPTEAEIAASRSQLAAAQSQQKVAQDTHDQTMRCETVTLPGGKKQEICPGLGMPEEHARYNLHAANASLTAAQVQLDQLLAGPTREQLDAANANVAAATAQRDAAQAQLDLLLAGASVYQIKAAQASVEQAQVALEMAQAELAKTRLLAPFDGVVTTVNVREEQIAPPSLPAFVLVDMSELQIIVDVDEIDVAQIIEGQTVAITVDALPDQTILGHVQHVAPAASQTGGVVVYQVTIVLDEADVMLRVGMTATADITVEQLEDVVLVPNWAIRIDREAGQTLVNVLRKDSVQEVKVELGLRGRDVSQVLSGLKEGDEIAAGEVESLRSLFGPGGSER